MKQSAYREKWKVTEEQKAKKTAEGTCSCADQFFLQGNRGCFDDRTADTEGYTENRHMKKP